MGLQIPVLDAASVGATGCKFPNDLQKRLEHLQKEASLGDVARLLYFPPTYEVKRKKRAAKSQCPAEIPNDPSAGLQDRSSCPWEPIIVRDEDR